MKNLTAKQQEIISQIEKEFSLANEQQVNGCDDIFAYIDSAVNKKRQYAEECKRNNAIFESVIKEKVECIIERINDVVERYGFECVIGHIHGGKGKGMEELIEYYSIKVIFNGFNCEYRRPKYKDLYLYTNMNCEESIWAYKDSNIRIYDEYRGNKEITDNNLEKYIASLVIEKLKSRIN